MSEYTELVKALRDDNACLSIKTLHEAADAIEALQRACANYAEQAEELQAAVDGYEATTDVEFVKEDGHERIRFVPKWIPVNERLPEEPGDYLVYVVGGEWRQLSWIDIDYFNGEKFRGGKWTTANPVAWMPLPEPPVPVMEYPQVPGITPTLITTDPEEEETE